MSKTFEFGDYKIKIKSNGIHINHGDVYYWSTYKSILGRFDAEDKAVKAAEKRVIDEVKKIIAEKSFILQDPYCTGVTVVCEQQILLNQLEKKYGVKG